MWFSGDVGTGKTTLAMLISKAAMESDHTVAIYSLPRLLSILRETYNEDSRFSLTEFIDMLSSVDLLHIDDVGAEQSTDWVLEQLYTIFNTRYEDGKAVLLTTNLVGTSHRSADADDPHPAAELVKRYFDAVNGHDWDALAEIFHLTSPSSTGCRCPRRDARRRSSCWPRSWLSSPRARTARPATWSRVTPSRSRSSSSAPSPTGRPSSSPPPT